MDIKKEVVLDLPNGLSLNVNIPVHVDVDTFLSVVKDIEALTHHDEQSATIRSSVLYKNLDRRQIEDIGTIRSTRSANSHDTNAMEKHLYHAMQGHADNVRVELAGEMQRVKDFTNNVLTNAINEFDASFASFGTKFNKLVDKVSELQDDIQNNSDELMHIQQRLDDGLGETGTSETLELEVQELRNKLEALSLLFDSKLSTIDTIPHIHSVAQRAHEAKDDFDEKLGNHESQLAYIQQKYEELNNRLDSELKNKEETLDELRSHVHTHAQKMTDIHEEYNKKIDDLKIHYDSKFGSYAPEPITKRSEPKRMPQPKPFVEPQPAPIPQPKPFVEPEPVTKPQEAPALLRPKPVAQPKEQPVAKTAEPERELPDMLTDLDKISLLIDKQIAEYKSKK